MRSISIGAVFNPNPMFLMIPRIDVNLIVALDPVAVLIVARDPDTFPSLGNPFLTNLPVTRWLVSLGWAGVDGSSMRLVGGDDR